MTKLFRFIVALLLTFSAGVVSWIFIYSQAPGWYDSLNKPIFTPPDWIFAPIWSILYLLSAIALVRVWGSPHSDAKRRWFFLFAIQLLLSIGWSVFFFALHGTFLPLIDLAFLWFMVFLLTLNSWDLDRLTFWLLIPYVAWVTFAAMLNVAIWWLN
jgi:benzodiazapine receptor